MESEAGSLVRALAAGGAVRIVAVDCLQAALHTAEIHGLGRHAARLAAETLAAAAVASAHVKGDERITLQLQGEEPRVSVYAEVRGDGTLRERLTPGALHMPDPEMTGILLAVRSDGTKEIYRGMTELGGESLEAAFGRHLKQSVQVDAVIRIGVTLDAAGEMVAAGGILVERMPTDRGRVSIEPESFAALFGPVGEMDVGTVLAELARGELLGEDLQILERRSLLWKCTCSGERVGLMLRSLGKEELDVMIREDHGAEVTCHFCNTRYEYSEDELVGIRDALPTAGEARDADDTGSGEYDA